MRVEKFAAEAAFAQEETRRVTFVNEDAVSAGPHYVPAGYDCEPLPMVVLTGAWTSVGE